MSSNNLLAAMPRDAARCRSLLRDLDHASADLEQGPSRADSRRDGAPSGAPREKRGQKKRINEYNTLTEVNTGPGTGGGGRGMTVTKWQRPVTRISLSSAAAWQAWRTKPLRCKVSDMNQQAEGKGREGGGDLAGKFAYLVSIGATNRSVHLDQPDALMHSHFATNFENTCFQRRWETSGSRWEETASLAKAAAWLWQHRQKVHKTRSFLFYPGGPPHPSPFPSLLLLLSFVCLPLHSLPPPLPAAYHYCLCNENASRNGSGNNTGRDNLVIHFAQNVRTSLQRQQCCHASGGKISALWRARRCLHQRAFR